MIVSICHNITSANTAMLVEESIETSLETSSSFNKSDKPEKMLSTSSAATPEAKSAKSLKRQGSRQMMRLNSFIRAHDLDVPASSKSALLAVDGTASSGTIMTALVAIGLSEAADESSRWTATSATDKILNKRAKAIKRGESIKNGPMGSWPNAAAGNDVLVWSSKCTRPGHGNDYPVVKSRGLVPASAKEVVELLSDSSKVKTYNKYSAGRDDQYYITQNTPSCEEKCPDVGVSGEAKIMSSLSQPPLTRKPLEFKTLFYARQLDKEDNVQMDGVAFITVGRSVWETSEGTSDGAEEITTRCDLLLSVNLIREVVVDNGESWCELTTVTHAVSPGIPIFVGKQLGLTAAENYVKDIRKLFEK
mmetsp:Transcript_19773/g.41563  ORF Transcript_19773/g.41563 Transcript_19773/m.41563 type:complete len:363 (-) Transcript_19773:1184-2272(-)